MTTLKNLSKRALALVLALMMCVSLLPSTAFAAGYKGCGLGNHTWDGKTYEVTREPTCTLVGERYKVCSVCDETFGVLETIPMTSHVAGSGTNLWSWGDDKTHTATCANCGLIFNENHSFAAATCVAPQTCTVCNGKNGGTDPSNHASLSEWKYDKDEHWQECSSCGNFGVNKAPHELVDGKCVVCGYGTEKPEPTTPVTHEHSFTGVYVQVGTAKHARQCAVEGCTETDTPEEHNMSEWKTETPATCVDKGRETRSCTVCSHKDSRSIPVTGHNFVDGVCTNCGKKNPNFDPSCDHNWVTFVGDGIYKAPTCVDNGIEYVIKCPKCGSTKETKVIAALGHEFTTHVGTDYVAPTCTTEGKDVWKCSHKGCEEQKVNVLPKTTHKYGEKIAEAPATCTTAGTKAHYVCTVCDGLFIGTEQVTAEELVIPALKHKYSEKIAEVPATCKDGMKAHYECVNEGCEAVFVGTNEVTKESLVIPATGEHAWSEWTQATDGHTGECRECSVCQKHENRETATDPNPGTTTDPNPGTTTDPNPGTSNTPGGGEEVVIPDPNVPQGGEPDTGDGDEVEIDDGEVPLANGPVTRAEFVDYLYRREGAPETGLSTFVDVPADHEYAEAIGWGQSADIAWGVTETEFAPDDLVTVEQVRLFLSRYAKYKDTNMPELAALVGLDEKQAALNCEDILSEFFGGEE